MPDYFLNGQTGNDSNSGTSESQAWKTLANSSKLKPGDTLIALPGTVTGTFAPPSGSAAAPITLRAKEQGTVTVDGSVRIDGLPWSKISKGYQTPFSRLAFNVFQRGFESDGKRANFNNRDFNQYGSNPSLDLHGTPAEFKWQSGNLRLNAIPSTPSAEPLFAAVTEVALNLNGKSHVNVEGIVTRGHKHAVATNGGTGIHFSGCSFTFCGSTAVWLVGLADASMVGCVVQGAGSWEGHYEDLIHTERVGTLRLEGLELSYGGHSGLIMLTGAAGKKVLKSIYFYAIGGSLLTLKRNVDSLEVTDCWFSGAAKSTEVDAHKVPHAGIQLSGKGHKFKNCVFKSNGKDLLMTSDGNADSNPVCSDNVFDHCTFSGTEAAVVEIQEYAPNGQVQRNTFRDCILQAVVGPQKDATLSCWYSGQSKPTAGRSNLWERCQIVGNIRGSQGSFSNVEAARGAEPSVYVGSVSGTLPGAGSSMTEPPSSGTTPEPPDPPDPPIIPPTTDRPVLRALIPVSGAPGVRVTATGVGFGPGPEVLVPVPDGARRLSPPGGTDTEVSWNMPADVVTGEVRVRNGSILSNPLVWTKTGSTPPVNQPPIANAGGPYAGTVAAGAIQFDGSASKDPDGSITRYGWEWGDGSAGAPNGGAKPVHTYAAAGTYIVTLTVTDNQGATATTTATVTITALVGELAVTLTAVPGNIKGATFSGVASERPVTLTITARTPDGRTATATATVAGDVEPPPEPEPPSDIEKALVEAVNAARAANGNLPPLAANSKLTAASRGHCEWMAETGTLSHTGSGGSQMGDRLAAAGYKFTSAGENIASGFSTVEAVMNAWMNSSGHRANLLGPYKEIGVAAVKAADGRWYWCQNFGTAIGATAMLRG